MSEAKHTPGPWKSRRESAGAWKVGGGPIGEYPICTRLSTVEHMEEESYANARLIAAAPDLLEALEEAANALDVTAAYIREHTPNKATAEGIENDARKARAAISKAEGGQ